MGIFSEMIYGGRSYETHSEDIEELDEHMSLEEYNHKICESMAECKVLEDSLDLWREYMDEVYPDPDTFMVSESSKLETIKNIFKGIGRLIKFIVGSILKIFRGLYRLIRNPKRYRGYGKSSKKYDFAFDADKIFSDILNDEVDYDDMLKHLSGLNFNWKFSGFSAISTIFANNNEDSELIDELRNYYNKELKGKKFSEEEINKRLIFRIKKKMKALLSGTKLGGRIYKITSEYFEKTDMALYLFPAYFYLPNNKEEVDARLNRSFFYDFTKNDIESLRRLSNLVDEGEKTISDSMLVFKEMVKYDTKPTNGSKSSDSFPKNKIEGIINSKHFDEMYKLYKDAYLPYKKLLGIDGGDKIEMMGIQTKRKYIDSSPDIRQMRVDFKSLDSGGLFDIGLSKNDKLFKTMRNIKMVGNKYSERLNLENIGSYGIPKETKLTYIGSTGILKIIAKELYGPLYSTDKEYPNPEKVRDTINNLFCGDKEKYKNILKFLEVEGIEKIGEIFKKVENVANEINVNSSTQSNSQSKSVVPVGDIEIDEINRETIDKIKEFKGLINFSIDYSKILFNVGFVALENEKITSEFSNKIYESYPRIVRYVAYIAVTISIGSLIEKIMERKRKG